MSAIGSLTDEEVAEQLARGCQKARYGTKERALEVAHQRHRKHGRRKARAYVCPRCSVEGGEVWHLTTCGAVARAFHRKRDRRESR